MALLAKQDPEEVDVILEVPAVKHCIWMPCLQGCQLLTRSIIPAVRLRLSNRWATVGWASLPAWAILDG